MNEQELPTFTHIVPGTPVSLPFVTDARQGRFEENRYPKYR